MQTDNPTAPTAAAAALDKVNKAAEEGKRGLTRQQLIEALAESDMNNGVLLDSLRERDKAITEIRRRESAADARIRVLEGAARDDRQKIDALKDMVRSKDVEIAHLSGYLERVREDDTVRDTVEHEVTTVSSQTVNLRDGAVNRSRQGKYDHGPGYADVAMEVRSRPEALRSHWSRW